MGLIKRKKVYYTDDWDRGKRVRRSLGPNYRIAKDLYDEFREALRSKRLGLIPKNTSCANFERKYLEFRKAERSLCSWRTDKTAFMRLHEAAHVMHLSEITPEFLQGLKAIWIKKGHSETSIGKYLIAIKTSMKYAELWKYIAPQSWRSVEIYQPPPRLIYFTMEEYRKMLEMCKEPFYTGALLMGRAGLRSGEARHLQFEDVDFERRTIWIRSKPCDVCPECRHNNKMWHPKGWTQKKTKERYVDMPPDLERHLQGLNLAQGFVLGPKRPGVATYQTYFGNLVKRAGLKGSAHAFRHTYGAHMVSAGVTLEALGELMGHADPKTTKIYAHLMPHARRSAVDKLPSLGS